MKLNNIGGYQMKKYLTLAIILSMLVPAVSATYWTNTIDELQIVEKDPSDWGVVENGAHGLVKFSTSTRSQSARFLVWGLEPKTKYQLIYYGLKKQMTSLEEYQNEITGEMGYSCSLISTTGELTLGCSKGRSWINIKDRWSEPFGTLGCSEIINYFKGELTQREIDEMFFEYRGREILQSESIIVLCDKNDYTIMLQAPEIDLGNYSLLDNYLDIFDMSYNDEWPYATCIGKARKTSTKGYFKSGSARFEHLDMWTDDVAQKFWVVLASDVDCEEGRMIAWNPTEYLFEYNTI